MITMFGSDNPHRARPPAELRAEQADRDYELARSIMQREVSDFVRGYRTCVERACRRARRCSRSGSPISGSTRVCFWTMPRIPLSDFEQSSATEEVYQELLRRRRESRKRGAG